MASTVSWARLFAANGVAAIAYANREPAGDLFTRLQALQSESSISETTVDVIRQILGFTRMHLTRTLG